jgi:hypothetical protein
MSRGPGRCQWGRSGEHKAKETGPGCKGIQLEASLCSNWDTRKRVLETNGISKEAEDIPKIRHFQGSHVEVAQVRMESVRGGGIC